MALSAKALLSASAAPGSTAGVAASVALPDNCFSVVIYNSGVNPLLISDSGVAVGVVLVPGTNARTVPIGGSFVWTCGVLSQRGSGSDITYGSVLGTTVEISYFCRLGGE